MIILGCQKRDHVQHFVIGVVLETVVLRVVIVYPALALEHFYGLENMLTVLAGKGWGILFRLALPFSSMTGFTVIRN